MITSLGGNDYVSGQSYTEEDIFTAYKQGLRNGKWEAEQVNKDDLYYESSYRAATEKFKKQIIELEEDCKKQYVKGKTDGYSEGYQHGLTLTKEKITELDKEELNCEYQRGLKEGRYLERLDSLNSRQYHYHLGYDTALSESNKPDYKQSLEEGFDKGYNTAIKEMSNSESLGEKTEYLFGTEGCCEQHNPNKGTQEAIQECLDKDNKHKYPHYFKDVRHLDYIDVYLVNKLFPVDDNSDCILHARKKLLVCGGRGGGKDMLKDIKEARDTLNRYLEIEGAQDDS